jgi:hypothetical protein
MTEEKPIPPVTPDRGALPLTRLLLPDIPAAPGVLRFSGKRPVPRAWEAVVPCGLCFALWAAALQAGLPCFAKTVFAWQAVAAGPGAALAAVLVCGFLDTMTRGWLASGRLFGTMLLVCGVFAVRRDGWTRATVVACGIFVAINLLAACVEHFRHRRTPP